jgi:phage repressor protein C with HTH and peptisase S24 domain
MRTAEEVLDKLVELKGLKNDAALARLFGVKANTVTSWRKRNSIPYKEIVALCEREGIPIGWLLTGQIVAKYEVIGGQRVLKATDEPGLYKQDEGHAEFREREQKYNDFVFIPQMVGRIAAGGGLSPDNRVDMRVAFRTDWIRRKGDPGKMSLIKVLGDSMEDTLLSGDLVLVDHGRDYLDPQGGIYALALNDDIVIKRLERVPGTDRVRIMSDNKRYEPLELPAVQVKINGKVIWFGRELERE